MKLCLFDNYTLGVVVDDGVIDVSAAVKDLDHLSSGELMNSLIANFPVYRPQIELLAQKGKSEALSSVQLRAPLLRPRNIDCMAVNYMEDGTRTEPAPINGFHKTSNGIIGMDDFMVLPDVPATIFEGEAELAVVIGKRASNVSEADAMEYVFGYTNFIDGSARGLPPSTNVFYQQKSRETFAPIGPWIVTRDEIKNPQNLQIRLWNNGVLKQNFNTNDMAHNIAKCIAWVSSIHTLEPGDILATGTNHRGLNSFMDGDRIELECEGCGRLRIQIKDDLKRTWARDTRLEHKQKGGEGVATPQISGKYAPSTH